jgi:predicted phosphodiesterase
MNQLDRMMADDDGLEMLLLSNDSHVRVADAIGVSEKTVRRWRGKHNWSPQTVVSASPPEFFRADDRAALHERLDKLLDTSELAGPVKGMKVGTWDTTTKNADGEAQQTRNYKVELVSTASVEPKWPLVQRGAATIKVVKPTPFPRAKHRDKLAVILPDPQIGFRRLADGTFDPFHDTSAINVALEIAGSIDPDQIIWLGDFLDLAPFGRFEQEATFAQTTQASLDYGYSLLLRANDIADGNQVLLEGNHDRRLEKAITKNCIEAFGLRQAASPEDWPVMSVPNLLRLDELAVRYVGGYPAGSYWLNERIKCIHGSTVRSNGSTAKAVVDEERVSVIFGHIHRIETHYKTSETYSGGRVRLAHTPGCLCRIDGAVPSTKSSTDLSGRPVTHHENWQQGLTVVSYGEGDKPFSLESVFINTFEGYTASFGGHLFTPPVAG